LRSRTSKKSFRVGGDISIGGQSQLVLAGHFFDNAIGVGKTQATQCIGTMITVLEHQPGIAPYGAHEIGSEADHDPHHRGRRSIAVDRVNFLASQQTRIVRTEICGSAGKYESISRKALDSNWRRLPFER
jgi:hypothetical protein